MGNTLSKALDFSSLQSWQESGDNSARLERLRRNLTLALSELTPAQKKTVEMYYFRQMTQSAIAAELGVHRSSVSRSLKRARGKLEKVLRYSL